MMVEFFFVLLCKSMDFSRHNIHFQVIKLCCGLWQ
jgi:hypothetical protein